MINVTATTDSLHMDGHAGYAPIGQDIVCASATILAYSAVETLRQMGIDCGELGNGCCHIEVPKGQRERDVLSVAINGLRLLAENYPNNVSFTFREEVENKESST